jgi:uncharacterized protein YndB with AHSA1/START domain
MAIYAPRDLAFADSAPVVIEAETVADVSPAAVWSVLIDHRGWPDWFGGPLVSCEPTSDPEEGVGSTRTIVLRPNIRIDERFIAWEPESLWAFTVVSGPPGIRSIVERCRIHVEGPGRTRVSYRMALDPKAAMRPLIPVVRRQVAGSLQAALENLVEAARTRAAGD